MYATQKKLLSFVILTTFFLSTGFLGNLFGSKEGGNSPEDTIKNIALAIEENDVKKFEQSIALEYWGILSVDKAGEQAFYGLEEVAPPTHDKNDKASKFGMQLMESMGLTTEKVQKKVVQGIRDLVQSGNFANTVRAEQNIKMPFAPEWLEKIKIQKDGSETASATIIMPNGQNTSLGLANTDKGWIVVSVAGNAKAARDRAKAMKEKIVTRQLAQERMAAFKKIFDAQLQAVEQAVTDKDMEEFAANAHPFIYALDLVREAQRTRNYGTDIDLRSVKLEDPNSPYWQQVVQILSTKKNLTIEAFKNSDDAKEMFEQGLSIFADPAKVKEKINSLFESASVVWQEKDLAIIAISASPKSKALWLVNTDSNHIQTLALSMVEGSKVSHYPLPFVSAKEAPFSAIEYLVAFGKNSEKYISQARELAQKKEKIAKEIMEFIGKVDAALASKDTDKIEEYFDLPKYLRDNGDLESTAYTIASQKKTQEDIRNFLQMVRKGITENNPLWELKKGQVFGISLLTAAYRTDNTRLTVKRDKEGSDWKIIYQDTNQRPDDWDKKVAEQVVRLEERIAKEVKEAAERLAKEQPKVMAVGQKLVDALSQKSSQAALPLVNITTLAHCPALNCDASSLSSTLKNQAAPNNAYIRQFSTAIAAGKAPENLAAVFDKDAWTKASFAFVHNKSQGIVVTLPTKDGERYALFAPAGDSYTLVGATFSDKVALSKIQNNTIGELQTVRGLNTIPDVQKGIITFSQLLHDKKGQEAAEYVDFASLAYWPSIRDNYGNVNLQSRARLFPELMSRDKNTAIADIDNSGALSIKKQKLTANSLENAKIVFNKDNFMVVNSDGNDYLFANKNGKTQLFLVGKWSNDRYYSNRAEEYYRKREEYIARELPKQEQSVASQTCVEEVLNYIKIKDVNYTFYRNNNSSNLYVKATFVATNTYSKPMLLDSIVLEHFDSQTKEKLSDYRVSFRSEYIAPNTSIRLEASWNLGKENSYLTTLVRQGKAQLFLKPYEVYLNNNKLRYTRNNEREKITKLADGSWKMGDFPPVKPRLQVVNITHERQKTIDQERAAYIEASEKKALSFVDALLDPIDIQQSGANALTIKNPHKTDIVNFTILMQVFDKEGILLQKRTQKLTSYRKPIKPGGSLTLTFKKPLTNPGESAKFTLQEMQFNNLSYTRGRVYLVGVEPSPVLYKNSSTLFTMTQAQAEGIDNTAAKAAEKAAADKAAAAKAAAEKAAAEKAAADKAAADKAAAEKAAADKAAADKAAADKAAADKAAAEKAAADKAAAEKAAAEKAAADKAAVEKAAADKAVAEKAAVVAQPTAPAPKKPGKAVLVPTTKDTMGMTSFTADGEADTCIRVMSAGTSPLIAIRVENFRGQQGSWKTKDVKNNALGVLSVYQGDKMLNANDASFNLDVTTPQILDLYLQDNGAVADATTRIRVVFYYKDGSRLFAILAR